MATTDAGHKAVAPACRLINGDGCTIDEGMLADTPTVVHFCCTQCYVVCPTTISERAERMRDLGAAADQIDFVLGTVDTQRYASDLLKQYIESFGGQIVVPTGAPARIKSFADGFEPPFSRQSDADSNPASDYNV